MDPLIEIGKQIPALAVLVYLVVTFLGHLRKQAEAEAEERKKSHDAFQSTTERIVERHATTVEGLGSKLTEVTESNRRVELKLTRLLERQGVSGGE